VLAYFPNLGTWKVETIKNASNAKQIGYNIQGITELKNTSKAMNPPAKVIGTPTKYEEMLRTLKRAKRIAPQRAKIAARKIPQFPIVVRKKAE